MSMKYYAIIGDIKKSKELSGRDQIQKNLNKVLSHINDVYSKDIAAKFIITLGDEFQGLLCRTDHLIEIIQYVQRELYPVEFRFGVGIGEISTEIHYEAAIGADGPAFYAARNSIEDIRKQERKNKNQIADIQICDYKENNFEIIEINTMLALIKVIENSWSDKQRYTIWDMQKYGGSQKKCAERMNTTQSTVARRLLDGNSIIYEKTMTVIQNAIDKLGDIE